MSRRQGCGLKDNGYILVATLAILLLTTLLAVGAAEISILQEKQRANLWPFWQSYSAIVAANNRMTHKTNTELATCLTPYQPDNFYWVDNVKLWPQNSCKNQFGRITTISIAEKIPQNLCKNNTLIQLYRITTMTVKPAVVIKLQTTQALLYQPVKKCPYNSTSATTLGQLSWFMK